MATNNRIEVYQQNSKLIVCDVSGLVDLNGYTGTLTVKEDVDGNIVISNTGSINDLSISFDLSYTDTSIAAKDYIYDVVIESSTNHYTVVQDEFIVLDSVKY